MKPRLLALLLGYSALSYGAPNINEGHQAATEGAVHAAVAASFVPSFKRIATAFSDRTGIAVRISSASSGQLFAQIQHGAQYDIFLSADADRPAALIADRPELGPAYTYAQGQLALFSRPAIDCQQWQSQLLAAPTGSVALAKPTIAPYGLAAKQVLTSLKISIAGAPLATNATTPLNWLHSGNIRHTLTAQSLAHLLPHSLLQTTAGSTKHTNSISNCPVPSTLHQPILQTMVALNTHHHTLQLWAFMQSLTARSILREHGYLVPRDLAATTVSHTSNND